MFQNWEFLIAEIWVHLLIAVALTLFLSWALWGMRERSERTGIVALQEDLQKTQRTLDAKESDLEQALGKQEQLKDRMSGFQSKLTEALAARKSLEEAAIAEQTKLSEVTESRNAVQKELTQVREKLAVLTKENAALVTINNATVSGTKGTLDAIRERLTQDAKATSAWTKKSFTSLIDKVK